jgi:hypothetical protein
VVVCEGRLTLLWWDQFEAVSARLRQCDATYRFWWIPGLCFLHQIQIVVYLTDESDLIPQFSVKIHSRCDLSCVYCYMYEMADQSWRDGCQANRPTHLNSSGRPVAPHCPIRLRALRRYPPHDVVIRSEPVHILGSNRSLRSAATIAGHRSRQRPRVCR